jgi:hypothetical protein
MKFYHVRSNGNLPPMVQSVADKFNGLEANKDNFYVLDSEISFLVVDCGLAHGNTTKADKSGWLYSKEQGGNLWNVNFDVK